MFILGGFLLGAVIGAVTAKRRGGARLDILQYAGAYSIVFTLLGLFLTIFLSRSLL